MTAATMTTSVFQLENLLSGRRVPASKPRNPLDWVRIVRQGLGAAAVGIPGRALLRRKKEGAFTRDESAKRLRLARAAERAAVVFACAEAADLPRNGRAPEARAHLQALGDAWAKAKCSAVLAVPSAIIPEEINDLLNPLHPAFARIEIGSPRECVTDLRLGER